VTIREHGQEPARPARLPASGSEAGEPRRSGIIGRITGMLDSVRGEVRKVTWPSPAETRNLTIVVIGISVLVGGILGIVDLILVALLKVLTGAGS